MEVVIVVHVMIVQFLFHNIIMRLYGMGMYIQHFGAKTLNSALETERRMYKDYLQQTNRDTPHVTQSIKGNIVRLKGLIGAVQFLHCSVPSLCTYYTASFKMLRREQSSHLQIIIEQKVKLSSHRKVHSSACTGCREAQD